jgi:hypothetical protein
MRSRTSLLSHILGSNQEICGHHELHIKYRSYKDVLGLKYSLIDEPNYISSSYLFDKILHNHLDISQNFIFKYKPKLIITIRRPAETINSIINMNIKTRQSYTTQEVVKYYVNRLAYLANFSESHSNNYYFFESDSLIKNTKFVLEDISRYLSLSSPLNEEYNIFRGTGDPGKGDISDHIKSGKIISIKNNSELFSHEIVTDDLNTHYDKCLKTLIQNRINTN